MEIKPNPNCSNCYGLGEVFDRVDYGSTTVSMPSLCGCVEEQIPEDLSMDEEIELDLSDYRD